MAPAAASLSSLESLFNLQDILSPESIIVAMESQERYSPDDILPRAKRYFWNTNIVASH